MANQSIGVFQFGAVVLPSSNERYFIVETDDQLDARIFCQRFNLGVIDNQMVFARDEIGEAIAEMMAKAAVTVYETAGENRRER